MDERTKEIINHMIYAIKNCIMLVDPEFMMEVPPNEIKGMRVTAAKAIQEAADLLEKPQGEQ